jgi:sugar phosphate isomerase/epimerase
MRIASSYAGYHGDTFEEFVMKQPRQIQGVQLIPDQKPNLYSDFSEARATGLSDLLDQCGLDCHLHNVFYDINIVSLVPDVQLAALAISKRVFDLASKISAGSVTIHPGYMFPGWRNAPVQQARFWEAAEVGLKCIADISKVSGVPALIENGSYRVTTASRSVSSPLHVGITPEELKRLLELTNGEIGLSFDFNKAIDSQIPISKFLNSVGTFIEQVQVSELGGHSNEWHQVINFLHNHKPDAWIIVESSATTRSDQLNILASSIAVR